MTNHIGDGKWYDKWSERAWQEACGTEALLQRRDVPKFVGARFEGPEQ